MSDYEDPEVIADLRLRESSMHDRGRSRVSEAALGTWAPSDSIVGAWKCKTPPCKRFVDVTEEAMERWAKCNEWLRARGEEPIDTASILRCEDCKAEVVRRRPGLLRQRANEMAELIRKLKASGQPRQEHDVIRQLTAWHHPDVSGLLEALDPINGKRKKGAL